ncbi:MAG: hypothetical protein Q8S42_19650 [Archangium sp.]|nr:hypothetical protein [Archangium sp.]
MDSVPMWLNAVLFLIAAVIIWASGTRLEKLAATLAERTGLGEAFTGMLLLAAATSLPELATTVTAVVILKNPTLAVHNLLGGVALQTLIIAIADLVQRRRGALTSFDPRVSLLTQGVGLILLLQVAIAGIAAKGVPVVFATSGWLVLVLLAYLGTVFLVQRSRKPRWKPTFEDERAPEPPAAPPRDGRSTLQLWVSFAGLSLLVLAGGVVATQTAEGLAAQTGLGDAFIGATLLAMATSLPEVSTTVSAARNGRFTAAISNVFGSNAFDVTLLLLADLLHRETSVLAHAGSTALFTATIGSAMTCIYVWGMIERDDRTVLRLGWDSVAATLVYGVGMTVLYFIQ